MSIVHLDFESRSDIDLTETGTHAYAHGQYTDIWCASYQFDDEEPQLWTLADKPPARLMEHAMDGKTIVAHNAAFEYVMWNELAVKKYGWPKIHLEQMECTMAMSYAMSLPGSLGNSAAAMGLDTTKDLEGRRLMLQMAKPRRWDLCFICEGRDLDCNACSDTSKIPVWWDDKGRRERLYDYCKQDVRTEHALYKRLLKLTSHERKVWLLDQRINERGIYVDVVAVKRAIELAEHEKMRLDLRMKRITGGKVSAITNTNQLTDFLRENGVETNGVAKDVVRELLDSDLPKICREALIIRQEASKSSVAKLTKILSGIEEPDNRLRGIFQYHGAGTGRWAGRRIQPHNFPRPSLKAKVIDDFFENGLLNIEMSIPDLYTYTDNFFANPLNVISDILRGLLTAAPGHKLIAADYSSIEARGLAWLAGEEKVLDVFRSHGKIYEKAAAGIYGKAIEEISKDSVERQIGKVAILALGYQGGVSAFQSMAKNYGVSIPDDEVKDIIARWRDDNPNIVNYWYALEKAAMKAVSTPGVTTQAGYVNREVKFKVAGSFLWCRLPSGRALCYPYPELIEISTPWGAKRPALHYMSCDSQRGSKWQLTSTYGGKLSENITQAICRDLLADAMLRLEDNGYPVVLHVHDESVSEVKEDFGSLEEYERIMSVVPEWAKGMPIKADGWTGKRFRK